MGAAHQAPASGDPKAAWRDLPDYAKRKMVARDVVRIDVERDLAGAIAGGRG